MGDDGKEPFSVLTMVCPFQGRCGFLEELGAGLGSALGIRQRGKFTKAR